MTTSKRRFFSGKSLDQALLLAASHYQVEPSQIAYKQRDKRHGFVKSRRNVVIEVDPENLLLTKETPAKTPPPAPKAPPPPVAEVTPAAEADPVAPAPQEAAPAAGDAAAEAPEAPEASEAQVAAPVAPTPPAPEVSEEAPIHEGMVPLPSAWDPPARPAAPAQAEAPAEEADPAPAAADAPEAPDQDAGNDEVEVVERSRGRRTRSRRRRRSDSHDRDAPPLPPQEEIFAAAKKAASELVRLAGLELTPHVAEGDERLEIDLRGPDIEDAIAEDGEVLEAIEYLAPRMMRPTVGRLLNCRVDCDGFRQERDDALTEQAHKLAEQVRESGRAKSLEPMNPADRRLVHVALANTAGVETESVGEGFFKRVTIRPA